MTVPTHAISIKQPWLELILRGAKTVEFRSWPVPGRYQGSPIALAATVGLEAGWSYLLRCRASDPPPPVGVILGVATIAFQHRFTVPVPPDHEFHGQPGLPTVRCDTDNRWWAWHLADVVRVEPIPCRGSRRFWAIPEEIRAALAALLDQASPLCPSPAGRGDGGEAKPGVHP